MSQKDTPIGLSIALQNNSIMPFSNIRGSDMSQKVSGTKKYLLSYCIFILCLAFQNCGSRKMDFKQDQTELASSSSQPAIVGTQNLATNIDEFTINSSSVNQSVALDMVWVIDNSGSMIDTASIVRKNLEGFLKLLETNSDFRFLLISRSGVSAAQVSLPSAYAGNSKFKQIDYQVESTDGPKILIDHLENSIPLIKSKNYGLDTFFRKDSKKTIIFVTDDESQINNNTIQNRLDAIPNWNNQYTVYGFVGLGYATSPCQARTGDTYINMANNTDGKTFNICDTDWSKHFTDLQNNVITKINAQDTVVLSKDEVASISAIYINNVKINSSKYTITKFGKKTQIKLKDLKKNDKVKIEYSYKK